MRNQRIYGVQPNCLRNTQICDNSDETKKERRQIISDLKDYYGGDLVEMKIEGCASLSP